MLGSFCKIVCVTIMCLMLTNPAAADCLEHEWQEATCSKPATCIRCGETRGDVLPCSGLATCLDFTKCSMCNAYYAGPGDHVLVVAEDGMSQTCTTCQQTWSLDFEHVQLGTRYLIENDAEVEFVSCEFVGALYQYTSGHGGSGEKEWISSLKHQALAPDGYYYKHIRRNIALSGNQYLMLQFNVTNLTDKAVDFLQIMKAAVIHDQEEFSPVIWQQDERKILHGFTENWFRVAFWMDESYELYNTCTGLYTVLCLMPDEVIGDHTDVRIELSIDDAKLTYTYPNTVQKRW